MFAGFSNFALFVFFLLCSHNGYRMYMDIMTGRKLLSILAAIMELIIHLVGGECLR